MTVKRTVIETFPMKRQQGLAVITVLLILIALTLIVLSASRNSILELRMSTNQQLHVDAMQEAQAGLDYAAHRIQAADVLGSINTAVYCTDNPPPAEYMPPAPRNTCTPGARIDITDPHFNDSVGGTHWMLAWRDLRSPSGALPRSIPTSAPIAESGYFHVKSGYDDVNSGRGASVMAEGLFFIQLKQQ